MVNSSAVIAVAMASTSALVRNGTLHSTRASHATARRASRPNRVSALVVACMCPDVAGTGCSGTPPGGPLVHSTAPAHPGMGAGRTGDRDKGGGAKDESGFGLRPTSSTKSTRLALYADR